MADHSIAWDHSDCDHNPDPTLYFCNPSAVITCHAVGGGESFCRLQEVRGQDICESWSLCDYSDRMHAMCPDFEHHDTGPLHCTEGHRIALTKTCNAIEYIDSWCDPDSSYQGTEKLAYKDAPIVIEWMGEGYYWWYAPTVTT